MADSHIATHSGHFGRNVRATIEAPDVPAANIRFLLFLPVTGFTRLYCLTNIATEMCGHLIPIKSRITVCVYWSCMNTLPVESSTFSIQKIPNMVVALAGSQRTFLFLAVVVGSAARHPESGARC